MIERIDHYSLTNPASIYDEDAMTSLQLAARTAAKVNECVTEVNNIPGTVENAVATHIHNGEFDKQISDYAGELEVRLNNLLGRLTTGSTTMDAEIIDARLGLDGVLYATLGEVMRGQFGKTLIMRSLENGADINNLTETGFYFWGTGANNANLPGAAAGCLLNFYGGQNTRHYQFVLDYNNKMHWRVSQGGVFTEWKTIDANTLTEKPITRFGVAVDFNIITEGGLYYFGTSVDYTLSNNPCAAGCLIVCRGNDYRNYQLVLGYDGKMYFRFMFTDFTFSAWNQMLTAADLPKTDAAITNRHNYSVVKNSSTSIYIYKRGVKGYIRYEYTLQTDAAINLNVWRLGTVYLCDTNKIASRVISDIGADLEGVVLLDGDTDHVGGVHGDEVLNSFYMFIDGKYYTMNTLENRDADNITFVVNSTIYNQDSADVCFIKNKQTVFDGTGVHVNCEWAAQQVVTIDSIRACMLSVNKALLTHYYDSNVNRTPTAINPGNVSTLLSDNVDLIDIYFLGDIYAHHWAGNRNSAASEYSTLIHDYGTRLKSYFNCYDGHTTTVGEKLSAVNHFYITC